MNSILVTGGAGYIGGHVVLALRDAGLAPVVLDDLSTGHVEAVPPEVPLVRGSTGDVELVRATLRRHLAMGGAGGVLSCGYGRGHSVREVLRAVERASGVVLPVRRAPRGAGDPPALPGSGERIRATLCWRPAFDDLDCIVQGALAWERRVATALRQARSA